MEPESTDHQETTYPAGSMPDKIAFAIELLVRRQLSLGCTGKELSAGLCLGIVSAMKDAGYVLGEDLRPYFMRQLRLMLFPETTLEG